MICKPVFSDNSQSNSISLVSPSVSYTDNDVVNIWKESHIMIKYTHDVESWISYELSQRRCDNSRSKSFIRCIDWNLNLFRLIIQDYRQIYHLLSEVYLSCEFSEIADSSHEYIKRSFQNRYNTVLDTHTVFTFQTIQFFSS